MAITLSHYSALDVVRSLRMEGECIAKMERTALVQPTVWLGHRWAMRAFGNEYWRWQRPSRNALMHVLVPQGCNRIRMDTVVSHVCSKDLPASSIVWLDEFSSITSPELLFVQMASELDVPSLVLLGHELCGHFTMPDRRNANRKALTQIPSVTSVEQIGAYLDCVPKAWGVKRARRALSYVADHAVSLPEAVLSTMYALPCALHGYGLGEVTLNERVDVTEEDDERRHVRYPDLMFSFAPVGINYDGEDHLDLQGIAWAARDAESAEGEERVKLQADLTQKLEEVRAKVVDDATRTRRLATSGRIVFPMTKENLYGSGNLDEFTLHILECAKKVFGADVNDNIKAINEASDKDTRYDLLKQLLFDYARMSSKG